MGKPKKQKSFSEEMMDLLKYRGFIIPTAEIYPSRIAGFYDFGPLGVRLRENMLNQWRKIFVIDPINPEVYEISGSIVLPEDVLIASGHAESFDDPIVDCTNEKCGESLRADHIIQNELDRNVEALSIDELNALLEEHEIKCPKCGSELGKIETFNLMLDLNIGAPHNSQHAYLRPETAQSIFLNYKNVQRSMRAKLPFAICQVGNSFRNEISPRQGLIRMRGFDQMEIETFVDPNKINEHPAIDEVKDVTIKFIKVADQVKATEENLPDPEGEDCKIGDLLKSGDIINEYLGYYMGKEEIFYTSLGIPHDVIRFRHMTPAETPFYSKGNYDIEIKLTMGWKEVVGNAYRTDHDLSTHQKHSGTKLEYAYDDGTKIIPHVIEPSFGVQRGLYCILEHCFRDKGFDRDWAWFQFPAKIAPNKVHVYPLMRKPPLIEKAREVHQILKKASIACIYDQAGNIGKRYARADEIGTPYCVTIDFDTIEKDNTVTIRNRDDKAQVRTPIEKLLETISSLIEGTLSFKDAGEKI